MRYVRLGASGLEVSRLCLGCMSFGDPARGDHGWTLNEERSRPLIRRALEAGINFFDTANIYSAGSSEEIVGKVLKEHAPRDEVVIATKVNGRMSPGPNGAGLSRKAIMAQIDASLRRLGVDYVDLYQIHRFDPAVPIHETLEALHDVVKAGKARYIGASSMFAWQFATMLHTSDRHGWARFVSMQNYVNLLYREEEREMLPLCSAEGVAIVPWSPLARGRLARPWDVTTERSRGDAYAHQLYDATAEADRLVVERVAATAERRGVPMAQVSLSWLLEKPGITAPLIGATKPEQIDDAVAALDLHLDDGEKLELEAPYLSHAVVGFG